MASKSKFSSNRPDHKFFDDYDFDLDVHSRGDKRRSKDKRRNERRAAENRRNGFYNPSRD